MVSTLTNETTVCRAPLDTWDMDTAEATVVDMVVAAMAADTEAWTLAGSMVTKA
jgi:hypothetical protein